MRGVLAEFSPGSLADPNHRVNRQASLTAERWRVGREGRHLLHGANAPRVSWHYG